jgi:alcohol dehydrogenase class IV
MRFEFATATRVLFGPGVLKEAGPLANQMGRRALIVTGSTPERAQPLLAALNAHGLAHSVFPISGEPTTDKVLEGARFAKNEGCDLVIGFGGGSAIDAGKALAALVTNPGELFDYLEVIGRGQPLAAPPLPFIAISTTAGTGAEVTRNAVLASPEHRAKVSLRSPLLLPRLAIVDPELTHGLPRAITASTGLDALTQLLEAYVSIRANPLTDALCVDGLRRAARSLPRACDQPNDAAVREDMALASLFSGMALANAGLGAVHGFAAPIGGMFPAPHGAVCAALVPHVMATNVQALRRRAPKSPALERYDEAARILTGNTKSVADDGVEWMRRLCAELEIPPLRTYGLRPENIPVLCEKAAVASSTKGNPIVLEPAELRQILEQAL